VFTEYASVTPSVILISRNGLLLHRWTGQLSHRTADEILASVKY